MNGINFQKIPEYLRELHQWVLWRNEQVKDRETKVPYKVQGGCASSTDPNTWATFAQVQECFETGDFTGIGFVFSPNDPLTGIDLDGCRNPETGIVANWAREIILQFGSYAEVSPSKTGVKIFIGGKWKLGRGVKKRLPDMPRLSDKEPAIEVYDQSRYFAMTGWLLQGLPNEPIDRQEQLDVLQSRFWDDEPGPKAPDFHSDQAIYERARKYVAKLPPAISGSNGHGATFHAACVLVLGFGLPETEALEILRDFNQRCQPQWSEKELLHKVQSAGKQSGERNYLRNAAPGNWQRIQVPRYTETPPPNVPKSITLVDAATSYINRIKAGEISTVSVSLPDLDRTLRGGVEFGEMILFAARPSHGKSCMGLQCVHHWTALGYRAAIVSEEMSAMMLGKRTLQFVSKLPQEHWFDMVSGLETDLEAYRKTHEQCVIFESCKTADVACESIRQAVRTDGVKCAVVDYAQLLQASGQGRYEKITNVSIMLRQLASEEKIILLVLCQMNREVEKRPGGFIPKMSDIRDSGQWEQDADVVCSLVWPWRMNKDEPINKYQFFIHKNRNRGYDDPVVTCRFIPDRQMLTDATLEDQAADFDRRWSDIPQ